MNRNIGNNRNFFHLEHDKFTREFTHFTTEQGMISAYC